MTWIQMCEVVSHAFRDFSGREVTPNEVWKSSPTGELAQIVIWFEEAKAMYNYFGDVNWEEFRTIREKLERESC